MAGWKRIHDLRALQTECAEKKVSIPFNTGFDILYDKVALGPSISPNRFVALPMEGCDSLDDGSPGEITIRKYERISAGGSGIIWIEAVAVCDEGRSSPKTLWLHERNVEHFAQLTSRMRATALKSCNHNPVIIMQFTHAGRYCKPHGTPQPLISHHDPVLDEFQKLDRTLTPVSDEYLDGLQDRYCATAALAARAGFDGVDVKCCHGYLLSGLLSAKNRPGKYGGPYENRTRFVRECVEKIKNAFPSLLVAVRMGIYDGIAEGWGVSDDSQSSPDLTEPVRFADELGKTGVSLLGITLGNPRFDPHFGRPAQNYQNKSSSKEHPLVGIERCISLTGQIQTAVKSVPVVVSGLGWLRELLPFVAAGIVEKGLAQCIGQGRGSLAYPDTVRDLQEHGALQPGKCCETCSLCSSLMVYGGPSGCPVRDTMYAPVLKQYRISNKS
jgi:2,4-dienoyl-CoA reductase (NADPH2)